jgi:hypothetical protein
MTYTKKIYITIIITIITLFSSSIFASDDSLKIISPNYFDEQNNIYDDIHYLEKEILTINFCSNEEISDLEIKIECPLSDEEISLELFSDYSNKGCYFSNYNLNKSPCDDFKLIANYKENNKEKTLTRTFSKQKQSLLINHVLGLDTDNLNDEELSYYLVVLKHDLSIMIVFV